MASPPTMTAQAFNIRGTSGSGKTHVARELLKQSGAVPVEWRTKKHPLIYEGSLFDRPFYLIGSYETTCGGCDTISSVHEVAALLDTMLTNRSGIIFYEGLMISHMIGTVGAIAKKYNDHHTMAFLDTPVDVCIARVRQRRLDAGNTRPFDPNRTLVKDHKAVKQCHDNAVRQGLRAVRINHLNSVDDMLAVIKKRI